MNEELKKLNGDELLEQVKCIKQMTVGSEDQAREIKNIEVLTRIQTHLQEHDLNMQIKHDEEARKERAEARAIEKHNAEMEALRAEADLKRKEYQLKVDEAEKQDYRNDRDFAYRKERDELEDERQRQQAAYQAEQDKLDRWENLGMFLGNTIVTIGLAACGIYIETSGPHTMDIFRSFFNVGKRL